MAVRGKAAQEDIWFLHLMGETPTNISERIGVRVDSVRRILRKDPIGPSWEEWEEEEAS